MTNSLNGPVEKITEINDMCHIKTSENIFPNMSSYHKFDTNIIVIPHNIKAQWLKYASQTNLKYKMVDKKASLNSFDIVGHGVKTDPSDLDFIIVISTKLKEFLKKMEIIVSLNPQISEFYVSRSDETFSY